MAYADLNEVVDLLGNFQLTGTSSPSESQATALTDQVGAEIDSALSGAGVTVPVTAPEHFVSALRLLNSAGAAALILRIMFPDATGAAETPAYAFWAKWYQDGLARLRDGTGIPDDVIGATSGYVAPSTYFTNNPDEEVDLGDIAEPFFSRSKVF